MSAKTKIGKMIIRICLFIFLSFLLWAEPSRRAIYDGKSAINFRFYSPSPLSTLELAAGSCILLIEDIPAPYKSEYLQNGSEFNKKGSAFMTLPLGCFIPMMRAAMGSVINRGRVFVIWVRHCFSRSAYFSFPFLLFFCVP